MCSRQEYKFVTSTSCPDYPPRPYASTFISISSPTYLPTPLLFPSCFSNLNSVREIVVGEIDTSKKNGKFRPWGAHSQADRIVEDFLGQIHSLHLYAYKSLQLNLH
jgi:hypothetical protein